MAFTEVFDNTFPADTQQAKLLGDDIRKFKVDIQERMAAISGLDAAKPDFASDTQPTKWNGIVFVAYDTGKIYRFSNPNWVQVTLSGVGGVSKYSADLSSPNFNSGSSLGPAITIPSGVVIVGSIVDWWLSVTGFAGGQLGLLYDNGIRHISVWDHIGAGGLGINMHLRMRITSSSTGTGLMNFVTGVDTSPSPVTPGTAGAFVGYSLLFDLPNDLVLTPFYRSGSGTFILNHSEVTIL